MSSQEQTMEPSDAVFPKRQPIGMTIFDWALIVLAVASSAIALIGSRAKTAAEPIFDIADAAFQGGEGLRIEIDETNQVKLGGQPIEDVRTLVERIKALGDARQVTISASEETLFATTDWVAKTLINSGVDQVQIVTSKRVETTE